MRYFPLVIACLQLVIACGFGWQAFTARRINRKMLEILSDMAGYEKELKKSFLALDALLSEAGEEVDRLRQIGYPPHGPLPPHSRFTN